MLTDFFKLNGDIKTIKTVDGFFSHFCSANDLRNVIYEPSEMRISRPKNHLRDKTFFNVSFSKTNIIGIEFINCKFEDCLFIGTKFTDCRFNGCNFICCNLYKADFINTYIQPSVFAKSLNRKAHSNIGVILFQNLKKNFLDAKQSEYLRTAEYLLKKWKRYQLVYEWRKNKIGFWAFLSKWLQNLLHYIFLGYGIKTRQFIIWSIIFFIITCLLNHYCWEYFQMNAANQDICVSTPNLIRSFYYTIIIITTLGFGDITPVSTIGMLVTGIESLCGIIWLSALASILIKIVIRY